MYSLGPLVQNVAILLQFVQNPMLCGLEGCDGQIAGQKMLGDLGYECPDGEEEDFEYEPDIEQHEAGEKNQMDD